MKAFLTVVLGAIAAIIGLMFAGYGLWARMPVIGWFGFIVLVGSVLAVIGVFRLWLYPKTKH